MVILIVTLKCTGNTVVYSFGFIVEKNLIPIKMMVAKEFGLLFVCFFFFWGGGGGNNFMKSSSLFFEGTVSFNLRVLKISTYP